jgi:asparagine synthase (glutamine-hydrolysing)
MCGISGLIAPTNSGISLLEQGKRMRDSLIHRGPDSEGIWVNGQEGLVLAHNRLAIQDLSEHGHQPMWSHSGRYCIVFNGEIYNFRGLARELISKGCQFSGHSDTEVLLSAVEEWGLLEAVKRLTGMFAFSIWDAKNHTLSLCRDRLGEKPLYYGWFNNCFCFASELKAIETIAQQRKPAINYQGLENYLHYGYISAPHSIYRGIYKLVPGTIFTFQVRMIFDLPQYSPYADNSTPGPKTYWSVQDAANYGLSNLISNEGEAIEELETLLHKTVEMQKIADVGVGVFLSGGIDSSTVAAIAQKDSTDKVKTFSIGFSEKEYDESIYAGNIARHLGTDHSAINVSSQDTLQIVPELPCIFDEPFADSSQIPMYIVSKYARSKITVCLSGDGGDELFAGYNRYLSTDSIWSRIRSIPYPLRNALGKALAVPTPGFWEKLYNSLYIFGGDGKEIQKLVGLKVQKLAGLMQQKDLMSGFICKAMYLDQIEYLPGDNLTKVDRASMAVSLETRLPLLSHKLVELSWRIPVSMKVRQNTSKWILRQVLYKSVPRNLIERPKMGFSVPIGQWLRNDLRAWTEDMFGLIGKSGYEFLREKPIRVAWNEHLSGKRDHSQRLWTVLMLLSWMEARR